MLGQSVASNLIRDALKESQSTGSQNKVWVGIQVWQNWIEYKHGTQTYTNAQEGTDCGKAVPAF